MKQITLILCGLLTLASCGKNQKLDTKIDKYLNSPSLTIDQVIHHKGMVNIDTSFLSAAAKANFDSLTKKMQDLMKEKRTICGLADLISTEDMKAISDIRDNTSIDQTAKKNQIKEILAKTKSGKRAHHEAMKKCKNNKTDQLKPIKDKLEALKTACMGDFGKHGDKHGDKKGKKHKKELSEQDKTVINSKLESSTCSAELAK